MNLFIFLLIWAFVCTCPSHREKQAGKTSPCDFASFRLVPIFHNPASPASVKHLHLPACFLRIFVAFIESVFTMKRLGSEETHVKGGDYYYYRYRRFPWKVSTKIRSRLIGVLFLAYLPAVSSFIVFWQFQRVANASYFSKFIHTSLGLPFNSEIPDGTVRLVTEELAVSIARRHMSEFGSNTQILGCHITKTRRASLFWVAVIGSTNVIAENYVKGL